ncbi:MFS general substrate transporter [Fomitopsis betulina]|nr:MFS general substrate transporter [Fomitopsis betulina]
MAEAGPQPLPERPRPWGLLAFLFVCLGIATDLLIYSLIVPIIPFQLEGLGYTGVSGLVGWLLFVYSAGIVIFTLPVAHLSEGYNNRKIPLLVGLVALIGAQIMFMLSPAYWLMVIARLLQGLSSTVVWVAGLSLLCDTVPESSIGKQIGIAMSGLAVGVLVGPPVSGALYDRFGFHGPFIFGIIVTAFDFIGRLLVIERKHAIQWGIDPAAPAHRESDPETYAVEEVELKTAIEEQEAAPASLPALDDAHSRGDNPSVDSNITAAPLDASYRPLDPSTSSNANDSTPASQVADVRISLWAVFVKLTRSVRADSVFICTLVYAWIITSQEPALPLHMQDIWGFNPSKVGLVYIASVVPTLFSSSLTGYLVDKWGTSLITVVALVFSLPWVLVLIVQSSLPLFIAAFALANFGIAGTVSPIMAELAAVTRQLPGVGYAHVYASFNIAYGVGSALGPIIGGQMYDHVSRGWMAICLFGAVSALVAIFLSFLCFGEVTLYAQLRNRCRKPCAEPVIESTPQPTIKPIPDM